MVRGLYTAATGMIVEQHRMDTLSNNIVNVETTGYKADTMVSMSFKDMLISRIRDTAVINATRTVGPHSPGAHIDVVSTDFTQGSLEGTDNPNDVAIVGDAFFTVLTDAGERYSRDGVLGASSLGYLTNGNGNLLLDTSGEPIYVGFDGFSIDQQGVVTAGGTAAGQLKMVAFENNGNLRKQGDNLYYTVNGMEAQQATDFVLKQGFKENSNVEISRAMVDMITTYRAFETNQKIVQMIDETLEKAVNQIGAV